MKKEFMTLALCGIVLIPACKNKEQEKIEPVTVEVQKIIRVNDVKDTPYVGRILPARSNTIVSANAGTLEKVSIRKGQMVQAGQEIARVYSENINSALAIAASTVVQAQDGYDRMMQLYAEGGVTELKKKEVESQLEKAQAALKSAEAASEKLTVRSPYSGIVEEIYTSEGLEVLPASPIARISNVSDVQISIPVPETEISHLQIGQEAYVVIPALETDARANIIVKGVTADEITHTYECLLNPDSRIDQLLPGMVCKVFLKESEEGKIIIPLDCVMSDIQGRYVWTVRPADTRHAIGHTPAESLTKNAEGNYEGLVTKTRIVVKNFASEGVVVAEGLKEGDLLVIEGRRKISSGMTVNVKR